MFSFDHAFVLKRAVTATKWKKQYLINQTQRRILHVFVFRWYVTDQTRLYSKMDSTTVKHDKKLTNFKLSSLILRLNIT